jgi:hypothetical protein
MNRAGMPFYAQRSSSALQKRNDSVDEFTSSPQTGVLSIHELYVGQGETLPTSHAEATSPP